MIDTVGVPSGIGDVSWAYSKLMHIGKLHYEVADGWPYRTVPFLEMLPQVAGATYGVFTFRDIVAFEQASPGASLPTWKERDSNGRSKLLIQPNLHLEQGRRLEDWLPDLPCEFHYEINTSAEQMLRASNKLGVHPRPWTGISCASYRGSEAWKTWGYAEWSPFLKKLHAELGGTLFLLGGFWDDLTDSLADDGWPSLVGRTDTGTVIEILRLLDYYLGFSSGLGVLRTVMSLNAFMLWPDHQVELSTSWAPPEMLEEGTYATHLWREPEVVMRKVRNWLKVC
jgi:hypothetical protein